MSTRDRARFYAERDRRTISYGQLDEALEDPDNAFVKPIGIRIGPAASETTTGQILVLTAVQNPPKDRS